jgi:D-alanine transaminase
MAKRVHPAGRRPPATERIGSYTTARVTAGRVERVERHAGRLRRDAERLGLSVPRRDAVEALLLETAIEAFGRGDGIVRIEWSAAPGAPPELMASHRPLGEDPPRWRARVAETCHPGPEARRNTKFVSVDAYAEAREEAITHGVDEVLLFDAEGHLVEGGHSNCLLVDADGTLVTPVTTLGAVEGLGLTIVRENRSDIREAKFSLADVYAARELMGVNAVRGVVPIIELDGKRIADGEPGPWARRLRQIFFRDQLWGP